MTYQPGPPTSGRTAKVLTIAVLFVWLVAVVGAVWMILGRATTPELAVNKVDDPGIHQEVKVLAAPAPAPTLAKVPVVEEPPKKPPDPSDKFDRAQATPIEAAQLPDLTPPAPAPTLAKVSVVEAPPKKPPAPSDKFDRAQTTPIEAAQLPDLTPPAPAPALAKATVIEELPKKPPVDSRPPKSPGRPFDKLDRDQMTPIHAAQLPDIAVAVVSVDTGSVLSCAFSSDGKLATGTDQGEVVLWDLTGTAPKEIGKLLPPEPITDRVDRLAFSGDGKRLAVSLAATLYVWDITEKGGQLLDSKPVGRIEGLAFSADGKLIACGANLGRLFAVSPEGIALLPGQLHGAQGSYTFSADGKLFASVFFTPDRNGDLYGSEVKFWKMAQDKPLEYAMASLDSGIKSLALSADSTLLATGSLDNVVRIWDMSGRTPTIKAKMASPKWIRSLSFTADGAFLVGFSSGTDLVLYDVAKGEKQQAWAFVPRRNSDFATGAMYLTFSASAMAPDGRHIAFSNHTAKTVVLRLPSKE